jgi:hypothetical protein
VVLPHPETTETDHKRPAMKDQVSTTFQRIAAGPKPPGGTSSSTASTACCRPTCRAFPQLRKPVSVASATRTGLLGAPLVLPLRAEGHHQRRRSITTNCTREVSSGSHGSMFGRRGRLTRRRWGTSLTTDHS